MRKRNSRLLFFLPFFCSVYLTSCFSIHESEKNIVSKTEIKQLLDDYYKTMSDRDWKAYRDFFSDKATLTTIWQEDSDTVLSIFTNTIDEFISKTKYGPDSQPIFEEKMIDANITVRNNLAQAVVSPQIKTV